VNVPLGQLVTQVAPLRKNPVLQERAVEAELQVAAFPVQATQVALVESANVPAGHEVKHEVPERNVPDTQDKADVAEVQVRIGEMHESQELSELLG
jgi:hypothetical protein